MPYCVNCGVKLDTNAETCPLCHTPVWHPEDHTPAEAPYFPTKPAVVEPVSRRVLGAVLSSMLASVAICCGVINLIFPTPHSWSLFVIGAAILLWIWFVLPLFAPRIPISLRLTMDVAVIGVYLLLVAAGENGWSWFKALVLPILAVACVDVFLLSFLLRGGRRSILTTAVLSIGAVGLFALGVEFFLDLYLRGHWQPTWSLIVIVICVGLIIPLVIIRRVPSLREEVRRRFSL